MEKSEFIEILKDYKKNKTIDTIIGDLEKQQIEESKIEMIIKMLQEYKDNKGTMPAKNELEEVYDLYYKETEQDVSDEETKTEQEVADDKDKKIISLLIELAKTEYLGAKANMISWKRMVKDSIDSDIDIVESYDANKKAIIDERRKARLELRKLSNSINGFQKEFIRLSCEIVILEKMFKVAKNPNLKEKLEVEIENKRNEMEIVDNRMEACNNLMVDMENLVKSCNDNLEELDETTNITPIDRLKAVMAKTEKAFYSQLKKQAKKVGESTKNGIKAKKADIIDKRIPKIDKEILKETAKDIIGEEIIEETKKIKESIEEISKLDKVQDLSLIKGYYAQKTKIVEKLQKILSKEKSQIGDKENMNKAMYDKDEQYVL